MGWKWPVDWTDTVVGPGDGDRALVVIVRVAAVAVAEGVVLSWPWLCGETVPCV